MPYGSLLLVHLLAVVLALGTNLTFPLWVRAGERDPAHLPFVLRRVRWLDRFVAIPGYAVAALSGLALALAGGFPLTSTWLAASIAIYLAVALLGFVAYRPVSRARLAALERGGPEDPAYLAARGRARVLDAVVIGGVLVILVLMLAKPL
ncbi:MAG TPA: DUF2269 family protein [Candidatus Limnocylindria bacterium]|nr:DUF2269 family protein [Candidatus Limnocylindria bacterium]